MLLITVGIIASYLIGSIPTAYIFGRLLKGVDIRKFGSGNVGATNALRVLGKGPGIAVLVLDILKGFMAVFLLGNIISRMATGIFDEARILFGLSCICGHNWTIFLGLKGGKGVATALGVLFGLALTMHSLRPILALLLITWALIFVITRTVSVASVLSSITLPIYMFLFRQSQSLTSLSIILSLFIILRHLPNIKRVLRGEESRMNLRKS